MPQQAVIRRPLDIGLSPQRVHPASGYAHISEHQLDHGHGADHLGAHGMLGPAHGIHDGPGFPFFSGGTVGFINGHQILF